jgi:uncharacterized protein YtpQ (UPF0354 family)
VPHLTAAKLLRITSRTETMTRFEHPLQLFTLQHPDDWELRYQEDTGGLILIHAGAHDACALSVSPLAVTGAEYRLDEEILRSGARVGVELSRETLQSITRGDTRLVYGEGLREEALPIGSRFRLWVLQHGPLALHVVHLGPGASSETQRAAADAVVESLSFPELMPPTPEEFRLRVLDVLAREYPQVRAESSGEWAIMLAQSGGEPIGTVGLENLYRTVLLKAESAGALIREYLEQVLSSFTEERSYEDYESVRDRLLPMLKSEQWVQEAPGHLDVLRVEFAPGLVICFAVDEPTRVAYVTRQMVESWDVPVERVQEVAQDNLAARQSGLELTVLNGDDGRPFAIAINSGDGYDATRLVLPSVREALEEQLGEEYLVGLPNRDFLIAFAPRDMEVQAGIIRQVKQDYHKMNHPITPIIYRVRAETIEPTEL